MGVNQYRRRVVEVARARRSGFIQRKHFQNYLDAVEYLSRDVWMNKEEKCEYTLKADGFEHAMTITYGDYKKGNEYVEHFRTINEMVRKWVRTEEEFLKYMHTKRP